MLERLECLYLPEKHKHCKQQFKLFNKDQQSNPNSYICYYKSTTHSVATSDVKSQLVHSGNEVKIIWGSFESEAQIGCISLAMQSIQQGNARSGHLGFNRF